MADRSSAWLFNRIFTIIANDVVEARREPLAKAMWHESRSYDFRDSQMDCDDELIKLGLAHKGTDPDYPDDGMQTIYEPAPRTETPERDK